MGGSSRGELPYPTGEILAMSLALDAETHRDIAASACSAALTAEAAAMKSPEKLNLLQPWMAKAAGRARTAAAAALDAANSALAAAKAIAGADDGKTEHAARTALAAAAQAEKHRDNADASAFAVAQSGLIRSGIAAKLSDPKPTAPKGGDGKPKTEKAWN